MDHQEAFFIPSWRTLLTVRTFFIHGVLQVSIRSIYIHVLWPSHYIVFLDVGLCSIYLLASIATFPTSGQDKPSSVSVLYTLEWMFLQFHLQKLWMIPAVTPPNSKCCSFSRPKMAWLAGVSQLLEEVQGGWPQCQSNSQADKALSVGETQNRSRVLLKF